MLEFISRFVLCHQVTRFPLIHYQLQSACDDLNFVRHALEMVVLSSLALVLLSMISLLTTGEPTWSLRHAAI